MSTESPRLAHAVRAAARQETGAHFRSPRVTTAQVALAPAMMAAIADGATQGGEAEDLTWAITSGTGTLTLALSATETITVDHRTEDAPTVEVGVTFLAPFDPVFELAAGFSYVVNDPPTVIGEETLTEGEAFSVDVTNDSGVETEVDFSWLREGSVA